MSSTSELGSQRLSIFRRRLPAIAAGVVLLITAAATFVGGCIRRVPAPIDDAPAESPYSAIATWLEVTLPPQTDGETGPLPARALRLAFGSEGRVWMDSALVDGREQAVILEEFPAAIEALSARREPIVVLGDPGANCEALSPLTDRVSVAVGTSRYSQEGKEQRLRKESLGGRSLEFVCPEQEESLKNDHE